ncbi:hypothetical protein HanPSC8_Chr17g0798221 [Helianthus annuus]|nr:hypothetical protein HanPSC8_Chr17g0798221 [Helianthus annuus]
MWLTTFRALTHIVQEPCTMIRAFSKVDITNLVNVLIEGHLHLKMAKVKQMQDVIEEQSEA